MPVYAAVDSNEQAEVHRTGRTSYQCLASPSRTMIALCGIGLGDVGPSWRMRLRIVVVHMWHDATVETIFPWLHGNWAAAWAPHDVLVVCGTSEDSVNLIYAYDFPQPKPAVERIATDEEKKIFRDVFLKKYGRDFGDDQSSEPQAKPVPPSAGQPQKP